MFTFLKNSKGLLGMNARNLSYIRPNNLQGAIHLANNKLRSKEALFKAGIPVPKIYGVIRNRKELEVFKWDDLPKSFVLKPNCGSGGKGIKVIFGQKKDQSWVSTEGGKMTIKDLRNHVMDIFEGFYSFSGASDIAFFEERIKLLKILKPYSYKGIPDIRVIVYNKVPVMAMLRLPTKESGGKANLHMGGIGLGVDIATGVTTNAVMHDQLIEKTPDTKFKLSGIRIPQWKEILEIAIKCQEISKLGYIGVDIAIDSERGPVVLEVNAHAGLSIQIANLAPLKYRLKKVSGLKVKNEAHGIRIAQDLFGGEVEEEIEDISGKQVLGIIETIKIGIMNPEDSGLGIKNEEIGKEAGIEIAKGSTRSMEPTKIPLSRGELEEIELKAKIDTGADRSSIDEELARKLGYEKVIDEFKEVVKDLEIENNVTKEILDEKIKDKLDKWGDDFDTVVIKSSHGVSYRLLIKMNIELSGIKLISKMSVTDRSHLEFPVIIGRRSLGRFLVDPSKKTRAVFGKDAK
ncbi:ATP-dependent zinc protease [Candidatus Parcubacteria bacterium]|nr:ATP-dependent zinc protease [Candidatus Parcubacteria bacterium]